MTNFKKFNWVNEAARKEYSDLPKEIQDEFGKNLQLVQRGESPYLNIKHLKNIGPGTVELIINGSPAFRCLYVAKYMNMVFVLHSFTKTTNGVDRQAMKIAEQRYKEMMAGLKAIGK